VVAGMCVDNGDGVNEGMRDSGSGPGLLKLRLRKDLDEKEGKNWT